MSQPLRQPPYFSVQLGAVGVLAVCVWWAARHFSRSIPSANGNVPSFAALSAYAADPVKYLQKSLVKHGAVFRVNLPLSDTYWLMDKRLNKVYFNMGEESWSFGDGMGRQLYKIAMPGYFSNLKDFVASLAKSLSCGPALANTSSNAKRETELALKSWNAKPEIDLFESISNLIHRTVVATLLGRDFYEDHVDELYDLLKIMEKNIGNSWNMSLPDWVPHSSARELWKARDRACQIIDDVVKERKADPSKWNDAIDYVSVTLREPTTENMAKYLSSHHNVIMFAAHISTVSTIAWTILELLKSPRRLQNLRQDLDRCENAWESPYMDAVLKETLRHYSCIADLRMTRRPVRLAKYPELAPIPAGAMVSISPYLTHHDPSTWLLPDTWYPERWLEDPNLENKLNSSNEICYMPFGAGVHGCPGKKLAMRICSTVISTIVRKADLSWGEAGPEQDTTKLDFSKIGSPWLQGDVKVKISKRGARR